jgi:ribulose kinase
VLSAGQPVGTGLTREAAIELGFGAEGEGIAVGSGVIDAYAGWIGSIAARDIPYRSDTSSTTKEKLTAPPTIDESQHRLAAVAGTSTCHLIQVKSRSLSLAGSFDVEDSCS